MTSIPVTVNALGFVEAAELGDTPYRVDVDGVPYVPVGDGGVVLGVHLGDGVFAHEADHVAPGVTLVHPDPAARHALTAFACVGNEVVVRDGPAAGQTGRVLGKRGELGRVVTVFDDEVVRALAPGDAVMVRTRGQADSPGSSGGSGIRVMNVEPRVLAALGVDPVGTARVGVRAVFASWLVGNGLGRPAHSWDVDLSVTAQTAAAVGAVDLALGDLVCISDLDVRHNIGFRRGWATVGVVVHGASPLPGHGPGVTPVLCGPADSLDVVVEGSGHRGVTRAVLDSSRG